MCGLLLLHGRSRRKKLSNVAALILAQADCMGSTYGNELYLKSIRIGLYIGQKCSCIVIAQRAIFTYTL